MGSIFRSISQRRKSSPFHCKVIPPSLSTSMGLTDLHLCLRAWILDLHPCLHAWVLDHHPCLDQDLHPCLRAWVSEISILVGENGSFRSPALSTSMGLGSPSLSTNMGLRDLHPCLRAWMLDLHPCLRAWPLSISILVYEHGS